MDELLRTRLRLSQGANLRIKALRVLMSVVDIGNRAFTGQAFFALRETEQTLIALDGRVGTDLVWALLEMKGGTTIRAHGLHHVPRTGRVVIGATHPVGTFDFIAHAGALLKHRPDLKVVANREAERFLGPDLLIPVDLDRNNNALSARTTRAAMKAHVENEGALLIFGSGRVPDMRDGLLVEPAWRMGVTRMSQDTGAPIIPASADLRNSRHYYRTRRLGRVLSGGNDAFGREVASLRYVSELLSKLGGAYSVHYGAPLAPGTAPETIKATAEGLVPGLYCPVR
ncbi:hypothetical protein [Shimia aestuarii]|uniref:Acyltransferase n=1 Tax=Shimia aestuarii TaxID=254406 RepID=A0A1I4LVA3_9RHOB|nr:hypothetical protein [Shimia aestuarii]SFL95058.1 hypothetical protein SAMN04488042_102255 [Shimia aestuarii]